MENTTVGTKTEKDLTDVLLIVKGWYNKIKYHSVLEALNAYYHEWYGNEDIRMTKWLALRLFLKPLVLEAIKRNSNLAVYLLENESVLTSADYTEETYNRCIHLIGMITKGTFDLSEYQEMFDKFKESQSKDDTHFYEIGII